MDPARFAAEAAARSARHRARPAPEAPLPPHCTAFAGDRLLAAGPPAHVALAARAEWAARPAARIACFDDDGRPVEFDLRGSEADVLGRLANRPAFPAAAALPRADPGAAPDGSDAQAGPRPRGRPRLGVVAREVTLLPRHWAWLEAQPGGASATLRRLVELARRRQRPDEARRRSRDAAWRFATAMAGDAAGFEPAMRALFATEAADAAGVAAAAAAFDAASAAWPPDVRRHARALAAPAFDTEGAEGADSDGPRVVIGAVGPDIDAGPPSPRAAPR